MKYWIICSAEQRSLVPLLQHLASHTPCSKIKRLHEVWHAYVWIHTSKYNKRIWYFRITYLVRRPGRNVWCIYACMKTFAYIDTHSPHRPSTGCVVFHSSFQLSEHWLSALYSGRRCQKESVSPTHRPQPSSSIQWAPALSGDGGRIPQRQRGTDTWPGQMGGKT